MDSSQKANDTHHPSRFEADRRSCAELRSTAVTNPGGCRNALTQADGNDWPRGTMTRPGEELRREGVLPDIDGRMLRSPEVLAVVLSHAHLDHYGLRIMFILTYRFTVAGARSNAASFEAIRP